MNISLSPELEKFIEEKVRLGMYASPNDVVQDAVTRLKDADEGHRITGAELSRLIAVGQADADRGALLKADEVFAEIRDRSAARRRAE